MPGRLKRDKKAERGMSRDEIKEAEEQVRIINFKALFLANTANPRTLLASSKVFSIGDPWNYCGQDGHQGGLCKASLD